MGIPSWNPRDLLFSLFAYEETKLGEVGHYDPNHFARSCFAFDFFTLLQTHLKNKTCSAYTLFVIHGKLKKIATLLPIKYSYTCL